MLNICKPIDFLKPVWYNICTRLREKGEYKMFYTSTEEYLATMTDTEWFDLMADCFADEIAEASKEI